MGSLGPTKRQTKATKAAPKDTKKAAKKLAGITAKPSKKGTPESDVESYLKAQNRPFSSTNVYENLKKVHSKPAIVKVLEKLVDTGIAKKNTGKNAVYWYNQDLQ